MVPHLNIVILAGGAGTRLWPMSTDAVPKQFQKLVSEKTMLQETLARVDFVPKSNVYVSTNTQYLPLVKEQLPEIEEANIIAEPCRRDTAPCIGLAAAMIQKKDPNAIMAVVYADHLVQDKTEFQNKVVAAAKLANEKHTLNIIEVKAKEPNVNLGYVKIGPRLEQVEGNDVHAFESFTEKPDFETAKKFVASYQYLWNTGYYVWRVQDILEAFKAHLPKTYDALQKMALGANLSEHYSTCDQISIDYGIMEKVDPQLVRILPADLGWSDIGTWASLHSELAKHPDANITKGNVTINDGTGNLIYNEEEAPIAVMGLHDMIVVKTKEALLICPKEKSADLKQLLSSLKA